MSKVEIHQNTFDKSVNIKIFPGNGNSSKSEILAEVIKALDLVDSGLCGKAKLLNEDKSKQIDLEDFLNGVTKI